MLPAVLSPDGGVQSAVVAADWSRLAEAYRMRGSLRVVDHLLTDDAVDAPSIDHVAAPRLGTLLGEQVADHSARTPVAGAAGAGNQAVSG